MRYFPKLTDRDKMAFKVLIIFFVGILLYWGVQASFSYRADASASFRESRLLLMGISTYGKKISMLEAATKSKTKAVPDQTLLTLVSSSAKDQNISFKRFQPDGDSLLQLWLEEVNFNVLLWWLSEIESKHGVRVDQISVERTKRDGFVNARITLVR